MKPVSPATGAHEVVVAENQPEYLPLPVAVYVDSDTPATHLLSRWTFTPEERAAIAAGEDVYIAQLNFGTPMTPMVVQVGAGVYAAPETLDNPFHGEDAMKDATMTDETTDEPTIEHLRNALQLLDLGDVAGARRRIELGIAALPVMPAFDVDALPSSVDETEPGAAWHDNPAATFTMLLLAFGEPEALVLKREDVTAWTPEQRREAEQWAGAVHCAASDNDVPEAELVEPQHVLTLREQLLRRADSDRTLSSDLTEDR